MLKEDLGGGKTRITSSIIGLHGIYSWNLQLEDLADYVDGKI